MRFAPGTDPKVIAEAEKAWLENKPVLGGKPRIGMPMPPAPDKDNPLYDLPPPPPVPDKDNPLYDSPVRPDMPRQTLNPRQVRDQALASAKDTRQQAMQAARAMEDRGQRLSAKKSALDAYANARNAAQQQYRATRLGPRTGGPTIDVMPPKSGIRRPLDPSMSGKPGMPTHITENGIKTADITPGTRRNMLQPPKPTLDTTMSDDFIKPRKNNQTGFLDRVKQSGMMKKGGSVKKYKAGGSVKSSSPMKSSASKRADGCAIKGKTRGRIV